MLAFIAWNKQQVFSVIFVQCVNQAVQRGCKYRGIVNRREQHRILFAQISQAALQRAQLPAFILRINNETGILGAPHSRNNFFGLVAQHDGHALTGVMKHSDPAIQCGLSADIEQRFSRAHAPGGAPAKN